MFPRLASNSCSAWDDPAFLKEEPGGSHCWMADHIPSWWDIKGLGSWADPMVRTDTRASLPPPPPLSSPFHLGTSWQTGGTAFARQHLQQGQK